MQTNQVIVPCEGDFAWPSTAEVLVEFGYGKQALLDWHVNGCIALVGGRNSKGLLLRIPDKGGFRWSRPHLEKIRDVPEKPIVTDDPLEGRWLRDGIYYVGPEYAKTHVGTYASEAFYHCKPPAGKSHLKARPHPLINRKPRFIRQAFSIPHLGRRRIMDSYLCSLKDLKEIQDAYDNPRSERSRLTIQEAATKLGCSYETIRILVETKKISSRTEQVMEARHAKSKKGNGYSYFRRRARQTIDPDELTRKYIPPKETHIAITKAAKASGIDRRCFDRACSTTKLELAAKDIAGATRRKQLHITRKDYFEIVDRYSDAGGRVKVDGVACIADWLADKTYELSGLGQTKRLTTSANDILRFAADAGKVGRKYNYHRTATGQWHEGPVYVEKDIADRCERLIPIVEAAIEKEVEPLIQEQHVPPSSSRQTTYPVLGITVDWTSMRIMGLKKTVSFARTDTQWPIFEAALEAFPGSHAWGDVKFVGGDPGKIARYMALGRLNKRLRIVGVQIKNRTLSTIHNA